MFRSFYSVACSSLVASACLTSVPANAIELCETRLVIHCTDGCYNYMGPVIQGVDVRQCDEQNFVITQDAFSAPPADPILQCDRTSQGYDCEAWPQGEEISYAWVSEQAGTVTINALNPHRYFSCGGGEVSVAVIGPSGAASVATATLPDCN